MPRPPNTTPAPTPSNLFSPAMTPVPHQGSNPGSGSQFDIPKLRLEFRDITHEGALRFLGSVNGGECAIAAVRNVLHLLYVSPNDPTTTPPATRSITLILRDMNGVAYTVGSDLDNDHKEVHFSLSYIASIQAERIAHEITGVISHEFVHALQYNGFNTCPGGLIEGIADWVRLSLDLAPPHWKRDASGKWDGGYDKTAYFLQYLEHRFGPGSVRRINEKLRISQYREDTFWYELFGSSVKGLWEDYGKSLK